MSKNLSVIGGDGNLIGYDAGCNKGETPLSVRIVVTTGVFPVTSIKPARLSFLYFDVDYVKDIIGKFPYCFYGTDEKQIKDIETLLDIKKTGLNTIQGNYVKKSWADWLITPIYHKDKINKFLKII